MQLRMEQPTPPLSVRPKSLRGIAYDATFVISNAVGSKGSENGTRLRPVGGLSVRHMHEAASTADELCLDRIGSFVFGIVN
jgi:hypothetical protein